MLRLAGVGAVAVLALVSPAATFIPRSGLAPARLPSPTASTAYPLRVSDARCCDALRARSRC